MSLKDVKKGDSVILKGFTGIKLGVFEVVKASEKTLTVEKKDGTLMTFSRKSGKQTNVEEGKEKYANSIMEDDGSYVPPQRKKKAENDEEPKAKKKAAKKAKKKEEPEEELEDDDEEFEDDFEDIDED